MVGHGPMEPTAPAMLHADGVVHAGAWAGVVIEVWTATATPEHFRKLARLERAIALKQPDAKIALLASVRLSNLAVIDAETRRAIEDRSRLLNPHISAAVIVLPAQGFVASIVRVLLAGIFLAVKP